MGWAHMRLYNNNKINTFLNLAVINKFCILTNGIGNLTHNRVTAPTALDKVICCETDDDGQHPHGKVG